VRQMTYLSPTSLTIYTEDKVRFYLLYLADKKVARDAQTEPMAIGSAFDAYVKNYLHEKLFGAGHDPRFDLRTLFEAQVESQNRDKSWVAGKHTFEEYRKSGALTDMMVELNASVTTPRFEFDLMGVVDHQREGAELKLGAVPFLGKPDLFYTNKAGARVMHDWKVNGFYSKSGASPCSGYVRLREVGKPYSAHKNAFPMQWKGIMVNRAQSLDMVKPDWAQQLSIYMWLCGEPVGTEDCVASIDQIVCRPGAGVYPNIRFAEHRCMISKSFQLEVYERAQAAWDCIISGHFFRNMPLEASQQRCKQLDSFQQDVMDRPAATTAEEWHQSVTRPY
jgi:hypothetical protein